MAESTMNQVISKRFVKKQQMIGMHPNLLEITAESPFH